MEYQHLKPEVREVISQMLAACASQQAIANQIGHCVLILFHVYVYASFFGDCFGTGYYSHEIAA